MRYLGVQVIETPESITVSTKPYADSLEEIDVSPFYGLDRSAALEVKTPLRRASGQLMWITSQNRIELCYENCMLANSIAKSTVKDLFQANKLIRKAKSQPFPLTFPRNFDFGSCYIIAYGDASFANLPDSGSQGGHIVFLADASGKFCPITWQSKRLQRVVSSTIAAECLAVTKAAQASVHLRELLHEVLPNVLPTIHVYSDNKSLIESVHSSTSVDDKHLQINISVLRDMLKHELKELRWLPSDKNLADCLTKSGASHEYLIRVLRNDLTFDIKSGVFVEKI